MRSLVRLGKYFRRYAKAYAAGFACLCGSNLLATIGPRFVQQAIDALIRTDWRAARLAAALIAIVALFGGVLRFGMRYLLNGASRQVETDLRDDLFNHLLKLSAAWFQQFPVGEIMARATNDLLALRMVAGPAVMYLVDTTVRTAMILPMMLAISPSLTLWALLPTLGLPVVMIVLGGEVHARSLAVQNQFGDMSAFAQEHVAGVRVVRAYAQEQAEMERWHKLDQGYQDRNMRLARAQGIFNPLLSVLGGIGAVIALVLGGRQAIAGQISIGAFVAFGVYLATLVWPMIALGWAISLIQRGDAATDRVDVLFHAVLEIADPAAPVMLAPAAARTVTFDGVWFRYRSDSDAPWVLQDISFTVPAGSTLGVVGATGSGKSTLLELLVRNYDPQRGRILLDGVDIRQLTLAELRRAVAMVPQETFLFSDTVRDNVLLGTPLSPELEQAAATSQLSAALPDLPDGWDTMLGERGINLSGGQRQRAAIARALVRNPSVLLFDDALSAVDAATETRILDALRRSAPVTRIIVSHRFSAVRPAEQIVVLDGGAIVERGTHDELTARGGRYTELLMRAALEEMLEPEVRSNDAAHPA